MQSKFPCSLKPFPLERLCPLLSYSPMLDTKRPLLGLLRALSPPVWAAPALSASLHRGGVPSPAPIFVALLWTCSNRSAVLRWVNMMSTMDACRMEKLNVCFLCLWSSRTWYMSWGEHWILNRAFLRESCIYFSGFSVAFYLRAKSFLVFRVCRTVLFVEQNQRIGLLFNTFLLFLSHLDCPTCGRLGSFLQKWWLAFKYSVLDAAGWVDTLYDVSLFRFSRALWTHSGSF